MAVELRGYQKQAVNAFQKNHYRGIFDMATGTGKTYTSIACAQEYYVEHGKQLLVILVPFIHLITQWKENLLTLCCFFRKSLPSFHLLKFVVYLA